VTRPSVPAIALIPIRLFFGATFLYAGVDKLLDPSFFDPAAPTSIYAQMEGFARVSPLAGLIEASLPIAGVIGLGIAIAEIGIGIGALTGLAFRVAAAGGAALSFLFFLTASWTTRPYYFGADLPYAAGWIALAIAGHGGLWVPERVRHAFETREQPLAQPAAVVACGSRSRRRRLAQREAMRLGTPPRVGYGPPGTLRAPRPARGDVAASPERRLLLQTAALAGIAAAAASLAVPLRALGILTEPLVTPGPSRGPAQSPVALGSPGASSAPSGTGGGSGGVIARISDIQQGGGAASFTVPFDAPAPLPAGDPGIVIQLQDGSFVAYDAVCTHAGCTVAWDQTDGVILCPCHEAAFDPARNAAVLQGPARRPLAALPIVVDRAAGTISLGA
jgi:thiosulfate dehydrogenase [quinone] large subunit